MTSLPAQFGPFKINYNTQKEKWKMSELISMCVQEEERLKSEQPDSAHVAITGPSKGKGKKFVKGNVQGNKNASVTKTDKASSSRTKGSSGPRCHFCKDKGHMRKECHKFREWLEKKEETWNLVESIASSSCSSINLTEKLLHFTNGIISRAAFGDKCKDVNDFISVVREGSELCGGFDMPDLFPSLPFLPLVTRMKPAVLENLKVRMDKVLDSIINDHLAKSAAGDESGDDDLIDVLLKLRSSDDCPLTMTNIKAIILDIFAGGTDNSSATLEWAMSEMRRNPKVMAKAQAEVRQALKGKKKITGEDVHELHYLKLVIKETLRLHPPAPLLPREVREECQINGYDMPIEAKVIVNLWAIGRNKRQWPDADSFRPERFEGSSVTFQGTNFEYIPFGAGRRICPGIQFAAASIELSLALLLNQFDWNLPDGIKPEESDMTERFGISVRKKNPLYVIPTPVSSFD
ncbi:hypothetical protein RJ639_029863 [Escallonia herrerae]|uniref:Cytochrome P450 n=1 Tax=Escallonia herrerae TaxID=1293975 RepID=A0AA88X9X7_9ASTE|nr:hypothetical protein RJ639_029863 [Escallonia herrerae]